MRDEWLRHGVGLPLWAFLLGAPTAQARDYFFHPEGRDQASGLTALEPLRSFRTLEGRELNPGDRIVLASGTEFNETLELTPNNVRASDSPESPPIFIVSSDLEPARIKAPENGSGIRLLNVSAVTIEGLRISSGGGFGNGIELISSDKDLPVAHITVRQTQVSGFRARTAHHFEGIGVLGLATRDGERIANIELENVTSFDNDLAGALFESQSGRRHQNITIRRSWFFKNRGLQSVDKHSGNGIIIGQTDGALVETTEAFENGEHNTTSGGPVGIWAWDSDRVVFRNNISHDNRTAGGADGGGFDFDGGVTNSLMENNLSYNNDGAGFLLCTFPGSSPVRKVVLRNNVSINDGRKNGYAGIMLFGQIEEAQIGGNTVLVTASGSRGLHLLNFTGAGVTLTRNQFLIVPGIEFMVGKFPKNLAFKGNSVDVEDVRDVVHSIQEARVKWEAGIQR